jgi:dihydrofolate reductase
MGKLILNLALSLDGFIEGPNGEYDWCLGDQDYGLTEFSEQIGALLMGRKTFKTLRASGEDPFPNKHKYIVSTKLEAKGTDETIINSELETAVRSLKNESDKDIWLFGGAQLTDAMLKEKLVDEIQLSVHPLLLGNGTRLFRSMNSRMPMELTKCTQYTSGLVQLHYRPKY